MSAEILRAAVALMRERAEATIGGPWMVDSENPQHILKPDKPGFDWDGTVVATLPGDDFGLVDHSTAEHIASWHPAVALATAPLLMALADRADEIADSIGSERVATSVIESTLTGYVEAVTFANAYLGATS